MPAPRALPPSIEELYAENAVLQRENSRLRMRNARFQLALESIGWMDEFLDADGARTMMNIARDAVNFDVNEVAAITEAPEHL